MRARLLTAAIGIPIFIGAALVGGVWWLLLVALITLLGLLEWHGLVRNAVNITLPLDALLGGGLLVLIAAYNAVKGSAMPDLAPAAVSSLDFVAVPDSDSGAAVGFGSGAVLFLVAVYAVARESLSQRRRPLAAAGAVLLGVVYVAGLLSHLLLLRGLGPREGLILTLLAIVGTWLTDTGAFFVGRWLGGRRLVPALSPNKTVAGAIGGWVTGFVGLLAAAVFLAAIPLGRAALLAAAVPLAAQLGDLLESAMKREAGVKDTGTLLPGHGGVLDRFDSLMLVAPTVYYLTVLL